MQDMCYLGRWLVVARGRYWPFLEPAPHHVGLENPIRNRGKVKLIRANLSIADQDGLWRVLFKPHSTVSAKMKNPKTSREEEAKTRQKLKNQ